MNRLILLAAGQGIRLRPLTDDRPKCMVPLAGKPLLAWHLAAARAAGIDDLKVVGGYLHQKLDVPEDRVVLNSEYATTNMVSSLLCAEPFFGTGFVMGYGDIVYNREVLEALLGCPHDIAVVVDRNWKDYWARRTDDILGDAESLALAADGTIASIGQKVERVEAIEGQYIGLVSFRGGGLVAMRSLLEREREADSRGDRLMCEARSFRELYMTDLLQGLIRQGTPVRPVWIDGGWLEIDSHSDLALAETLVTVDGDQLRIRR